MDDQIKPGDLFRVRGYASTQLGNVPIVFPGSLYHYHELGTPLTLDYVREVSVNDVFMALVVERANSPEAMVFTFRPDLGFRFTRASRCERV